MEKVFIIPEFRDSMKIFSLKKYGIVKIPESELGEYISFISEHLTNLGLENNLKNKIKRFMPIGYIVSVEDYNEARTSDDNIIKTILNQIDENIEEIDSFFSKKEKFLKGNSDCGEIDNDGEPIIDIDPYIIENESFCFFPILLEKDDKDEFYSQSSFTSCISGCFLKNYQGEVHVYPFYL